MIRVSVEERGRQSINAADWKVLRLQEAFWHLVSAGVLDVVARQNGGADVMGRGFVGLAVVSGYTIECREKIPGAFASLLAATYPSIRLTRSPVTATPLGEMFSLLVASFISASRKYVSEGREWRYVRNQEVSPLAGGRLRILETVRLKARGQDYLLAYDKQNIDRGTAANRVLCRALQEVGTLRSLVSITESDLYAVRSLQLYFEDSRDYRYSLAPAGELAREAEVLSRATRNARLANVLELAAVVLSHSSFEHGVERRSSKIPSSWFVNLESMFERGVLEALGRSVPVGVSVRHGRTLSRPVFERTGLYQADPDLVVEARLWRAIGDVKYKSWTGKASSSDLYQLLAHAQAFDCSDAFLIFPDDTYKEVDFGISTSGVRVVMFTVDVRDLASSVDQIVDFYRLNEGR